MTAGGSPNALEIQRITPPPMEERAKRHCREVPAGGKRDRYCLPLGVQSGSPIGYRTRLSMTEEEVGAMLPLLALRPPTAFDPCPAPTEEELFEEASLGVLSSRQSTNFRGQRQVTVGPDQLPELDAALSQMGGLEDAPLSGAGYAHVVLARPYRTPFTLLLTFVGHRRVRSLATVPRRAIRKRRYFEPDIPTIGYLTDLHLGILADGLERAVVIASEGRRRAQTFVRPFCGAHRRENRGPIRRLERLVGLTRAERRQGWRVEMVTRVGGAVAEERMEAPTATWRKMGANLLSFRSERIQPGVNQETTAPPEYQERQQMDVSEDFAYQAGRAAFNAFTRWTKIDRASAQALLMLDRIDVLSPGGKSRLRALRGKLNAVTDRVVAEMPKWADVPLRGALTRNAERGRKAFALAGQRIYVAGLSLREVEAARIPLQLALRGVGASAARGALYVELMGVLDIPEDCDMLGGCCIMAGPVNQDDIGRTHYGMEDMLSRAYPERLPTSLLVWTLKAKTVADPIGNEEQLLNAKRKGALVDLRPS
ncbi:MAG: hypothetical protein ACPHRO_07870, partial [Nannocystaceae bacterium]